jgi:hypothetical protein
MMEREQWLARERHQHAQMEELGEEATAKAAAATAAAEANIRAALGGTKRATVWAHTHMAVSKIVRALKRAMLEEDGEWVLFQVLFIDGTRYITHALYTIQEAALRVTRAVRFRGLVLSGAITMGRGGSAQQALALTSKTRRTSTAGAASTKQGG